MGSCLKILVLLIFLFFIYENTKLIIGIDSLQNLDAFLYSKVRHALTVFTQTRETSFREHQSDQCIDGVTSLDRAAPKISFWVIWVFTQPGHPQLLVWPRKYVHSSFSSLVQSLLPKDTLLRTYLTSLQVVTGTVWPR